MAITRNHVANKRIVLLLGEPDRGEMQPLVRWLHRLIPQSSRLAFCPDLDSLLNPDPSAEEPILKIGAPISESLKKGDIPDLVVVLQSEPDEYSSDDVSQLLGSVPLARVVVCCGQWCESLGRNRKTWPLSVQVPVWAATSRIQREWQLIQDPDSLDQLPWTASREEIFAYDHLQIGNGFESETVAVDSPDPAYQNYLLETIKNLGGQTGQTDVSILLFDADPWNESRELLFRYYQDHHPRTVIVALVDQVDASVTSQLLDRGANQVVQKLGFHRQILSCSTKLTNHQIG